MGCAVENGLRDALQQVGDDVEAEAVAGVGVGEIGGVFAPRDGAGLKKCLELGLGGVEEGAKERVLPVHGLHWAGRREATAPLPSGQAHEHGLQDVVLVVAQEDAFQPELLCSGGVEGMAGFSGSLFGNGCFGVGFALP